MLVSNLLEGKGTMVVTVTKEATVGDVVADLAHHRVGRWWCRRTAATSRASCPSATS